MIIDILLAVSIGAPIEEKIRSNHMKKRSKAQTRSEVSPHDRQKDK